MSAESIAEKQRRISGQSSAAEAGEVAALEEEVQRLRNELTDKEEVGLGGVGSNMLPYIYRKPLYKHAN